ncbi:hypothetical protein SAMN02799630_00648 [Paenibacillus sp. UNCCL117]|uniref:hypothetical protein n=1 Tax=unclassified Paenibacillus TaxID=185978 RepID=UPI00088AE3E4|nr:MULTISPECIES: hypothetical protein [unclassified Paenibacillus]SDC14704.1 hypothetical protein SAMN04488602_101447 [Paenibacillus sp. cl123]SFW17361.1 hypothetical protein SAMN02799630_00648 [Paenibacillus sp. UNCCL117]
MAPVILLIAHLGLAAILLPKLIKRRLWRDTGFFALLLAYSAYSVVSFHYHLPQINLLRLVDYVLTPPGLWIEHWTGGPPSA